MVFIYTNVYVRENAYVCIYMYVCECVSIRVYERERKRQTDREKKWERECVCVCVKERERERDEEEEEEEEEEDTISGFGVCWFRAIILLLHDGYWLQMCLYCWNAPHFLDLISSIFTPKEPLGSQHCLWYISFFIV